MYDIKPLEEKWRKYNRLKRRPMYIFLFLAVGALGSLFVFLNLKDFKIPSFSTADSNEQVLDLIVIKKSSVLLDDALRVLQENKAEMIEEIKPPVQIKVAPIAVVSSAPTLPIVGNIPMLESTKRKVPRQKARNTHVEKEEKRDEPRKKVHLNIVKSSSIGAFKDVEKRFYESRDADDSLFLAKSYYRNGKYKKSEYWALQTNKVNSNIEESWIVFAKSKAKLGHRNQAIDILNKYIKRSNSSRVRNLLYKLKRN